ncbi:hypothetical protein [uncultured Williamsia sp.]|uniref:hypothetical protein n=1 Tax=uncultured Williamsia sp. TaxID=259311 RepID=UPI002604D419|nr:hypothetical protein [uncultured Williamsia sp.]
MRKGEAADDAVKELAVDTADELIGKGITRHQAFETVAANFGVHPHTIRNWWRAAHPELTLTDADRVTLAELQIKLARVTALNQELTARLLRRSQPSGS